MNFNDLSNCTEEEILDCFNLAFSDYFVPFKLTIDQLKNKIHQEFIDQEYSVGTFDNGKLVGFILHGFKKSGLGKHLYNGGTGVIPSHRRRKLTQKMYAYSIPKFKEKNVTDISLEVISKNIQAIKSYERSGFEMTRTLNCYKGEIREELGKGNYEIKTFENTSLPKYNIFQSITPTWQNTSDSIARNDQAIAIGAFEHNRLVGYIVINKSNNRIQQIVIAPILRRHKIASTLLNYVKENFSTSISIINVDNNDPAINNFLVHVGLENYLQQYEMKYTLTKEN